MKGIKYTLAFLYGVAYTCTIWILVTNPHVLDKESLIPLCLLSLWIAILGSSGLLAFVILYLYNHWSEK